MIKVHSLRENINLFKTRKIKHLHKVIYLTRGVRKYNTIPQKGILGIIYIYSFERGKPYIVSSINLVYSLSKLFRVSDPIGLVNIHGQRAPYDIQLHQVPADIPMTRGFIGIATATLGGEQSQPKSPRGIIFAARTSIIRAENV